MNLKKMKPNAHLAGEAQACTCWEVCNDCVRRWDILVLLQLPQVQQVRSTGQWRQRG